MIHHQQSPRQETLQPQSWEDMAVVRRENPGFSRLTNQKSLLRRENPRILPSYSWVTITTTTTNLPAKQTYLAFAPRVCPSHLPLAFAITIHSCHVNTNNLHILRQDLLFDVQLHKAPQDVCCKTR
jgi:hypothetical protein